MAGEGGGPELGKNCEKGRKRGREKSRECEMKQLELEIGNKKEDRKKER